MRAIWLKGYQRGSLGKSHQNGDYLKTSNALQKSNLQPLDYRFTALPFELEKTSTRMLNFGYLNQATKCLFYDVNNNSDVMFRRLLARALFNRLRAVWSKGYQRGSLGKSNQNGDYL